MRPHNYSTHRTQEWSGHFLGLSIAADHKLERFGEWLKKNFRAITQWILTLLTNPPLLER
jgi:hypothetical protein